MPNIIIHNNTTELINSLDTNRTLDETIQLFKTTSIFGTTADLFGNKAQNAKCWLVSDIYDQLKLMPTKQRKKERIRVLSLLGGMSYRTFMEWKDVGNVLKRTRDSTLFGLPMIKILNQNEASKRLTSKVPAKSICYKTEYDNVTQKYINLEDNFNTLFKKYQNLLEKYVILVDELNKINSK